MITYKDLNLTDRYTLLDSLPKSWKTGVEIGCWEAWYTCNMIMRTSMRVTTIDPWVTTPDYDSTNVEISDVWQQNSDGCVTPHARYLMSLRNLQTQQADMLERTMTLKQAALDFRLYKGYFEVWRGYSYDLCAYVPDNIVDFLYIDGEHNYEAVTQDMQQWWRTIKHGGIMAGHDYNEGNPGTRRSVDEFVEKHNLEFQITGINEAQGDAGAPSWVIIKP